MRTVRVSERELGVSFVMGWWKDSSVWCERVCERVCECVREYMSVCIAVFQFIQSGWSWMCWGVGSGNVRKSRGWQGFIIEVLKVDVIELGFFQVGEGKVLKKVERESIIGGQYFSLVKIVIVLVIFEGFRRIYLVVMFLFGELMIFKVILFVYVFVLELK